MRTNIDIDDALMAQALAAGPYRTKKDAVDAGLRLLARQAAYREVLQWRGKLRWEGGPEADWAATPTAPPWVADAPPLVADAPPPRATAAPSVVKTPPSAVKPAAARGAAVRGPGRGRR